MLTDAYVVHGLPTAANFFNRFRTGEMPIGLGDNALYLQLIAAAPELNGKWKMAPLPGIRQDDGNVVRRYPNAAGAAMVILKASSKQKRHGNLLIGGSPVKRKRRIARRWRAVSVRRQGGCPLIRKLSVLCHGKRMLSIR